MSASNNSCNVSTLDYTDRVILEMYKKFYGEPYPADGSEESHCRVQNMCYLLNLAGFNVGGFYHTWN